MTLWSYRDLNLIDINFLIASIFIDDINKSIMKRIYIHQVGMSVFGKRPFHIWELIEEAVRDGGIGGLEFDGLVIGNQSADELIGEGLLATKAMDTLGVHCKFAHWVNSGSASGAAALQLGCQLLGNDDIRKILVIGAEKKTSAGSTAKISSVLARVLHRNESSSGATMVSSVAKLSKYFIDEGYHSLDDWTAVAVKNHTNSCRNKYAHFQKEIPIEKISKSPIVVEPLRLFDCSPISDGAVAVILSKEPSDIEVLACETGNEKVELAKRKNRVLFQATEIAAGRAYQESKIQPHHVEFAEIHDAFTPFELIGIESVSLTQVGRSPQELAAGRYHPDGELPINASGGLKGRGHPVGASGLAQVAEIAKMMRGTGVYDYSNKRIGLAMSIGGLASQNFVTIVANRNL